VIGAKTPRLFTPPLRELTPATSLGFEAITFAEDVLRLHLMPWQRWLLEHMLELKDDGTFRFRTVLVQVARQNGKSTLAQALALWRMFVDRSPLVIGTAQNLDVAEEVWNGAVEMAEGTAELASEIAAVERTNGKKALRLQSGERYKVAAASRRGGRGLSGDLVLLDEIREHHAWDSWAAVTKTTMARPKPQIVALSNAGDSASIVLNHLRDLGVDSITSDGGSLGFFEWSAPDNCDIDDRDAWAQANPALGHLITEDSIAAALSTDPEPIFRTEVLCQRVDDLIEAVIPAPRWAACAGAGVITGPVALAVDVALDRSVTYIAVAGRNDEDAIQVELAAVHSGTDWVVERVTQMLEKHQVVAVGARSAGPTASLLPELRGAVEDAQVVFAKVGSSDFSGQCGWLFDQVMTGSLRHRDDVRINMALAAARRHRVLDAWQWSRTKATEDAAPLVAVTLASALFAQSIDAEYDILASVF